MINVPIVPPRVAFLDPRTGSISREWYMFFLSQFRATSGSNVSLDDLQKGAAESVSAELHELQKQVNDLQVAPQQPYPLVVPVTVTRAKGRFVYE